MTWLYICFSHQNVTTVRAIIKATAAIAKHSLCIIYLILQLKEIDLFHYVHFADGKPAQDTLTERSSLPKPQHRGGAKLPHCHTDGPCSMVKVCRDPTGLAVAK